MLPTKRIQFLDYDLVRSGRFSANELALLNIIQSFSERCEMNQGYLAKAMNKSTRTIQRTINSLVAKGMIRRTYTTFKRCVLVIVTLDVQKHLKTASGMMKQALKAVKKKTKNLMKSTDMTSMSDLIMTSMSQPTRTETQEIKLLKPEIINLKPRHFDINKAKEEALRKLGVCTY